MSHRARGMSYCRIEPSLGCLRYFGFQGKSFRVFDGFHAQINIQT